MVGRLVGDGRGEDLLSGEPTEKEGAGRNHVGKKPVWLEIAHGEQGRRDFSEF